MPQVSKRSSSSRTWRGTVPPVGTGAAGHPRPAVQAAGQPLPEAAGHSGAMGVSEYDRYSRCRQHDVGQPRSEYREVGRAWSDALGVEHRLKAHHPLGHRDNLALRWLPVDIIHGPVLAVSFVTREDRCVDPGSTNLRFGEPFQDPTTRGSVVSTEGQADDLGGAFAYLPQISRAVARLAPRAA